MPHDFVCRGCEFRKPYEWKRECSNCGQWYNVRRVASDREDGEPVEAVEGETMSLCDVDAPEAPRVSTGIPAMDRILGKNTKLDQTTGLLVNLGHVVQIYGSAGSGKSTLLLQMAKELGRQRYTVLYVAGEENLEQIKARADRIGKFNARVRIIRETDLDAILDAIEDEEPTVVIIDSINSVAVEEYRTGSVAAIQIAAREFYNLAKSKKFSLWLVVQITKSGDFSGPESLIHLIDTSLYLQLIDKKTRHLETKSKNRFGEVPAEAFFKMTDTGLVEIFPNKEEDDEVDDDDDDGDEEEDHSPPPTPEQVLLDAAEKTAGRKPKVRAKKPPAKKPMSKKDAALKEPEAPPTPKTVVIASDNVPADFEKILSVNCRYEGCRGQRGRACTSGSGKREAGFHQSRVDASRAATLAAVPVTPATAAPLKTTAVKEAMEKVGAKKSVSAPKAKRGARGQ